MITWSHLCPEDVTAWVELTNLLARVDRIDEFSGAEDLAERGRPDRGGGRRSLGASSARAARIPDRARYWNEMKRHVDGKERVEGSFDYVALDVDSASPTGATRLYERTGFSRPR